MNWQQRNCDHYIFTFTLCIQLQNLRTRIQLFIWICVGVCYVKCLQYSQIASPLNIKTVTLNKTQQSKETNTQSLFPDVVKKWVSSQNALDSFHCEMWKKYRFSHSSQKPVKALKHNTRYFLHSGFVLLIIMYVLVLFLFNQPTSIPHRTSQWLIPDGELYTTGKMFILICFNNCCTSTR